MNRVIELRLNNQRVEVTNPADLGIRLDRIAQSKDNLAVKGSDFSTTITIPKTKNNNKVFVNKDLLQGINKFNALADYIAEIFVDGEPIIYGTFRLNEIGQNGYKGELKADAANWIELLDGEQLTELGYDDDGNPTWFFSFDGAPTINSANNAETSLYRFPVISYNNVPIIDYFDIDKAKIFGEYDVDCNEIVPPVDYPNEFPTRTGYFSWRDGLTFEDFPPAINYLMLIRKCFEQIGWNVKGNIFDEEWFKALILPYVGEGFNYNWKTLGYLYTELLEFSETAFSVPFFNDLENFAITSAISAITISGVTPNITAHEDILARQDAITNFRKYLVTDSLSGRFVDGGYVAPASGRYRIRVKSYLKKELAPDGPTGVTQLDAIGNGVADYGWDDNVLLITRRDTDGGFVFNSGEDKDFRHKVLEWQDQLNTDFIDSPNDVIAYISPKRYDALGANIEAVGSPLSNWNETVNVISSSHTILSHTSSAFSSESEVEIEIEIDLDKNERVNFYWTAPINTFGASFNSTSAVKTWLNVDTYPVEIEYLCGYEDIDVASNLPKMSVKEFISSFINQFNLRFNVEDDSKTVEFILPDSFYSSEQQAIDITNRVDFDTISIQPLGAPKTFIVGYDNDGNDRLLVDSSDACTLDINTNTNNYANIAEFANNNAYASGELSIKNIFSATKFINGTFELMDIGSGGITLGSMVNPYPDCNGKPDILTTYWKYNGGVSLQYDIPSIQSQSSFEQDKVGKLEYLFNYKPRVMYFLGTANQVFGIDSDNRIKIDSRGPTANTGVFTVEPTVCSFDAENGNPYPSLRYDTYLYDKYFENLLQIYNKSHILQCEAALRGRDWRELQGNVLVRFQGVVYRILEIRNFDPLGENLTNIVLLRIV